MSGRKLKPCGSVAAYFRHYNNGEDTCQECRDAWAAYQRARRVKKPRTLVPIDHGTYNGYATHKRRGEVPCEPCMEAQRVYQRAAGQRRRDRLKAAAS